MKETHYDKIVKTITEDFMCYGMVQEKNKFNQSIGRSICKLREKLDTSTRELSVGMLGVLTYKGKRYQWFESMRGKNKYFYLKEIKPSANLMGETVIQPSLFNNIVQAPFGVSQQDVS